MTLSLRAFARCTLLTSALLGATQSVGCDAEAPVSESSDVTSSETRLCAAVRGNGPRIPAHFGALARIHEHYGMLWGISGGSSGSVTSFLTESIYDNPLLTDCGPSACSSDETAARAAVLFKSFEGYLASLGDTEEGQAFSAASKLAAEVKAKNVEALLASNPEAGVQALRTILESNDLRDLVNPEVLALLASSPNPAAMADDLLVGLRAGLAFSVDSERVFLRPGLLSFPGLANKLGRVAGFYAGDGSWFDELGMQTFFEACATPGRGLDWSQVSQLPAAGTTCGALFGDLLARYRTEAIAREGTEPSRLDAPLGRALHVLVSTSLLEGETAAMWERAKAAYEDGAEPVWSPSFDEVKVGYFGSESDLTELLANPGRFDDLKTRKALALRGSSWRTALETSPAEPGLSAGVPLEGGLVSVGGWPDLYPVQALRNLGCDEIVYVTREGGMLGSFADQVATNLGMSDDERSELFSLGDPRSSFGAALEEADAVWCTDWDAPAVSDVRAVVSDAFGAPLETTSEFFVDAERPYPNATAKLGKKGCSAGVGD